MAHSIGPNPNFIPRLDVGQLENLRQTSGTAAQQVKNEAPPAEDSELSPAARRSLAGQPEPAPAPPSKEKPAAATANATPAQAQAPAGNPNSPDKEEAKRAAAKLAAYDDPETVYRKVMEDIPDANAEAAERVLEGQMKQGLSKVSNLKTGPEAQEAGRMQMKQADFMADPLDIRDDPKPMPLQLE